MTDETAMRCVFNGDLDKAAILYERYKRPLLNFFLRFGVEYETCHDLTQQTFFRLIHYKHTFKEGYEFRTWIYRIARNLFHDHLKDNHLKMSELNEKFDFEDEQNIDEDQHKLIRIALEKLPDEYREVLHLSRYEEMKYEQISEMLNISVALVKVRVHRAIKKLREVYMDLDVDL
jgi:RNA polymerase sigma factor (sigma-70 family)